MSVLWVQVDWLLGEWGEPCSDRVVDGISPYGLSTVLSGCLRLMCDDKNIPAGIASNVLLAGRGERLCKFMHLALHGGGR